MRSVSTRCQRSIRVGDASCGPPNRLGLWRTLSQAIRADSVQPLAAREATSAKGCRLFSLLVLRHGPGESALHVRLLCVFSGTCTDAGKTQQHGNAGLGQISKKRETGFHQALQEFTALYEYPNRLA